MKFSVKNARLRNAAKRYATLKNNLRIKKELTGLSENISDHFRKKHEY